MGVEWRRIEFESVGWNQRIIDIVTRVDRLLLLLLINDALNVLCDSCKRHYIRTTPRSTKNLVTFIISSPRLYDRPRAVVRLCVSCAVNWNEVVHLMEWKGRRNLHASTSRRRRTCMSSVEPTSSQRCFSKLSSSLTCTYTFNTHPRLWHHLTFKTDCGDSFSFFHKCPCNSYSVTRHSNQYIL